MNINSATPFMQHIYTFIYNKRTSSVKCHTIETFSYLQFLEKSFLHLSYVNSPDVLFCLKQTATNVPLLYNLSMGQSTSPP